MYARKADFVTKGSLGEYETVIYAFSDFCGSGTMEKGEGLSKTNPTAAKKLKRDNSHPRASLFRENTAGKFPGKQVSGKVYNELQHRHRVKDK